MTENQALLRDIESYLSRTGVSATTFGARLGNWKMVERLRSGGSVTLRTAERIRKFLRNPPEIKPKPRRVREVA